MSSLKFRDHRLSSSTEQIDVLRSYPVSFTSALNKAGITSITTTGVDILQMNLGKMCNQTCAHCHVDAGPDRKEIMTREVMEQCLQAVDQANIRVVDLTGGAPEMNPNFRWLVEELSQRGVQIMVRCNLTIILANPKYNDLPEFFKKHRVEVISSLPHFARVRTDAQRGEGVFDKSIRALQMLNNVGYGIEGSGLSLNLVYNPAGAFLPPSQNSLARDFKERLEQRFGIVFNSLFAITNMPISRFLDYLIVSENYEQYMAELVSAFNPTSVDGLMCRNTLSVGWDGILYDCDFNQMLEIESLGASHIKDFDFAKMKHREVVIDNHCFGCTAGAGSSCGGEIV